MASKLSKISTPRGATSEARSPIPHPPTIALPKGGGAIRGIGEKFDVDLSTGTGSASIPIAVSKSRAIQPDLTLKYDSGSGNGPFSLGWTLSLPCISRKTSKGVPRYRDLTPGPDSDVFLLSGQEDLVLLIKRDAEGNLVRDIRGNPVWDEEQVDGYLVRRYAPRIEGLFSRIEMHASLTDPADIFWKTITSVNETVIFGNNRSSRITDPNDTSGARIFSWLLSEQYDDRGNAMMLKYKQEDSTNVPLQRNNEQHRTQISRSANSYPKLIRYGNVLPNRNSEWKAFLPSKLPEETWKFSIVFDYGEHDYIHPTLDELNTWSSRLDPFSTYSAGFEIRSYRLCNRILMFHHFKELGPAETIVSAYEFTYAADAKFTTLSAVQKIGYNSSDAENTANKQHPPVTYEYSSFPSTEELQHLAVLELDELSQENMPAAPADPNYQFVDLDGEGLSGFLTEQAGSWYYKRNLSVVEGAAGLPTEPKAFTARARFGPLEQVDNKPSVSMSTGQVTLSNINGTGTLDLVVMEPAISGFYERLADGGWSPFRAFNEMPNISLDDPNIRFVDLTGDGLADILICRNQVYQWFPSQGALGYGAAQIAVSPALNELGSVATTLSEDETDFHLADMSGDGLIDLVRVRTGEICYWPGLGHGNFGQMIVMDNSPVFGNPDEVNAGAIILTDIDGSGTTDILYAESSGVKLYLNLSGNEFSAPISLTSMGPCDSLSSFSCFDLLGTGTSALVWSSKAPDSGRRTFRYIDFMQGKKPRLLERIINNLGAETSLHYLSSTRFYLEDRISGNPWISRIPFPVHCLSRLEVIDHISDTRHMTRYRYHHGYYDGHEREFRGFGMVEQWDTDELPNSTTFSRDVWHTPSTHTKTWFHTGFFAGESLSLHMAFDYYGHPGGGEREATRQFTNTLLDDTVLPALDLSQDEVRQACRALRSHILRRETYVDQGPANSSAPLSVDESNFSIVLLQPGLGTYQSPIFLTHPRESLTSLYEQDSTDPRTSHQINLEVDNFGNVSKSLQISYGRREGKSPLKEPSKRIQETTIVNYAEVDYTNSYDSTENHRTPAPCEHRTYEITGLVLPTDAPKWDLSFFLQDNSAAIMSADEIPFEQEHDPSVLQKRLCKQTKTIYRSDDLSRLLPLGHMQSMALPGERFSLCLTLGLIDDVFGPEPGQTPSIHLLPNASTLLYERDVGYRQLEAPGWWRTEGTVRYHRDITVNHSIELKEARKVFFTPHAFLDQFNNASMVEYDSYMLHPVAMVDPMLNRMTSLVDYRVLAPSFVEDANGNRTMAAYDAHGLMVGSATMGKVGQIGGENLDGFVSDLGRTDLDAFFANPRGAIGLKLLQNATTRTVYNVERYWRNPELRKPTYSCTISRVTDLLRPSEQDEMVVSFSYSDGFQRLVQSKTQASAGPLVPNEPPVPERWIGSGWTMYNERGLPTRQWEPFFDSTPDFTSDMKVGVSSIVMYDALDRPVVTIKPDHTIETSKFKNAWSRQTFDASDNVLLSDPRQDADFAYYFASLPVEDFLPSWHEKCLDVGGEAAEAAREAEVHANTTVTAHLDPQGRSILVQREHGSDQRSTVVTDYDFEGNERSCIDSEGRITHVMRFDMCGTPVSQVTMDAGKRWMLQDGSGAAYLSWNGRNIRNREIYDSARRHKATLCRSGPPEQEKMVMERVYGEKAPQARANNLIGKLWQLKDQSGTLTTESIDFRENIISTKRQLLVSFKGVTDLASNPIHSPDEYRTTTLFDSLARPVQTTCPDNTKLAYTYGHGGYVERIMGNVRGEMGDDRAAWSVFVDSVQSNARGQTETIKYGNAASSRMEYDPKSFRLKRLLTTKPTATGHTVLQDLNYTYDAVGSITHLRDDSQQTIHFQNDVVKPINRYKYDSLYRLLEASGREHLGQVGDTANAPTPADWDAKFHSRILSAGDGKAMGNYTQKFEYDSVGAIRKVVHAGNGGSGWTRSYIYGGKSQLDPTHSSNRVTSTEIHGKISDYEFDERGNMLSMPHMRLQWNYRDQLCATSKNVVNDGTPETTYYVYDANGTRIRKVTESMGTANTQSRVVKEQIYLGGVELFRQYASSSATVPSLARSTLRVKMGDKNVANIETRTAGTDAGSVQLVRFQLDNSIGSSCLELDKDCRIISYEEYYPYGATSYQAVRNQTETPKRYRFCGNERDEESGMYYHQARYYAPWLGLWASCDPAPLLTPGAYQRRVAAGKSHGDDSPEQAQKRRDKYAARMRLLLQNLYSYALNNPVNISDNTGQDPTIMELAQQFEMYATELVTRISREGTAHGIHFDTYKAALGELFGAKIPKDLASGTRFMHQQSLQQAFNGLIKAPVDGARPAARQLVPEIYRVLNLLRGLGPGGVRVAAEGWARIKPAVDLANNVFRAERQFHLVAAEIQVAIAEGSEVAHQRALSAAPLVRGAPMTTQLQAQGLNLLPRSIMNGPNAQALFDLMKKLPQTERAAIEMVDKMKTTFMSGTTTFLAFAKAGGRTLLSSAASSAGRALTTLGTVATALGSSLVSVFVVVQPEGGWDRYLNPSAYPDVI